MQRRLLKARAVRTALTRAWLHPLSIWGTDRIRGFWAGLQPRQRMSLRFIAAVTLWVGLFGPNHGKSDGALDSSLLTALAIVFWGVWSGLSWGLDKVWNLLHGRKNTSEMIELT
jgi:type II secretory pathway component PulM